MPMPNQFSNQLQTIRGDTGQPFQQRTGFNKWARGNPELFRQVPKYSGDIQNSVNQLLQQGFQGLQNPYQGFENISNEATRKYNTETIPGIAERFASVPGGQRSSGYLATLGGSGEDFQSKLAAMKEMFGQQNKQQSLQQIGFGLQNQPNFVHTPKNRGWFEGLLGPALGGGGYEGAYGGQDQTLQFFMQILSQLLGGQAGGQGNQIQTLRQ
jgi:hypothetical protein